MAIKPTIYKLRVAITDLNRDYYDSLNVTIAQHPSETLERMMARVIAYCINAEEGLIFTKGLSEAEEADIWVPTLDEQYSLWIEVGEPMPDRVKKIARQGRVVKIYTFNTKSDVWWSQNQDKLTRLPASFYQLSWEQIQQLATKVQRTMDWSMTISENAVYVSTESGECEIIWKNLYVIDE